MGYPWNKAFYPTPRVHEMSPKEAQPNSFSPLHIIVGSLLSSATENDFMPSFYAKETPKKKRNCISSC